MKKKIVTYDKMSKKQRRLVDRKKRLSWGLVKPATVSHKDERDYDRAREKREVRERMEEE
ncbi:MAG: hypothetical protein IJM26_03710 [Lachnospiraceae bacterium]|nr:hypothetical protein [Lachnospiraceae bacterium]MBR0152870.1 hypothetical protein [Lachnospiraceae bacterium]